MYPQKRGENYIYEGLILRLLKHRRQYYDTNVVGYFASPVTNAQAVPKHLANLDYVRAIFKDGLEPFLYTGEEFFDEKTDESVKPAMRY